MLYDYIPQSYIHLYYLFLIVYSGVYRVLPFCLSTSYTRLKRIGSPLQVVFNVMHDYTFNITYCTSNFQIFVLHHIFYPSLSVLISNFCFFAIKSKNYHYPPSSRHFAPHPRKKIGN